ncbi:uncharacterized protein DS421_1g05970 [Arachis hypogaea]|nr:uncharacterized protein DS421_1g05970 [Arachis hypogaea]
MYEFKYLPKTYCVEWGLLFVLNKPTSHLQGPIQEGREYSYIVEESRCFNVVDADQQTLQKVIVACLVFNGDICNGSQCTC